LRSDKKRRARGLCCKLGGEEGLAETIEGKSTGINGTIGSTHHRGPGWKMGVSCPGNADSGRSLVDFTDRKG